MLNQDWQNLESQHKLIYAFELYPGMTSFVEHQFYGDKSFWVCTVYGNTKINLGIVFRVFPAFQMKYLAVSS